MVKNGSEQCAGGRQQSWKCATWARERNARRIRVKVGLDLQLYLGHAKTPEALEFSKTLIRQRKDELNARVQ